ncbi:hypothetical protein TWF481_007055 [Arthrobotrys musiformis]|uniref:C2H2-type domain-containing protein n=1 Tax=Arthrobotrys musiformis TaxID=47236 RepID=A0AAV9WB62_9PEZI
MAPYHNFDDSDDDSDDGLVTLVTRQVPGPQEEEDYPCEQCPEFRRPVFKSHAELVKHKTQAEHPYCKKCDQDFPSRDALEIHVLKSNRHITCFVCIKEFRSESGLQYHTQQCHQSLTGALCPQCHENFNTQAGLLQHIEGNLCPGGLHRVEIYTAIEDHQHRTNQELRIRNGNDADQGTDPESGEYNPAIELVNSFSHFKIFDQKGAAGTRPENAKIEVDTNWWDPERRHYKCPFPRCGKKFKGTDPFYRHLNSDAHIAKNFCCPGCKNRFASSSAMLQHVESRRCRLIQTGDFDRVKGSLILPTDQSRLTQSLATMSYRSEALSTVSVASDAGDNLSTVGTRTKASASDTLSTVGNRPGARYSVRNGKKPAAGNGPGRVGNNNHPSSTAGGSEALSTVGTNRNQFAENQLQQLRHAWADDSDGGVPVDDFKIVFKGRGKAKARYSPTKSSVAVNKRNAPENLKPGDNMEYTFNNDSDEEEGTLSTVV